MPNVLTIGPYRFYFWSLENGEPPHIHAQRGREKAKFWLLPVVELAYSRGFPPHELNRLLRIVIEYRDTFVEAWNEHFHEDDADH